MMSTINAPWPGEPDLSTILSGYGPLTRVADDQDIVFPIGTLGSRYFVAFEDGTDFDYNDLVVELLFHPTTLGYMGFNVLSTNSSGTQYFFPQSAPGGGFILGNVITYPGGRRIVYSDPTMNFDGRDRMVTFIPTPPTPPPTGRIPTPGADPVPEPDTIALLLGGIGLLALSRAIPHRKRRG